MTSHCILLWAGDLGFFFTFLFLLDFTLQYCIDFAIHWHESTTGVHEFPNMNPPSHLSSHIISLDHPRAPAPSILYPTSNIDWRFVSKAWYSSYCIRYLYFSPCLSIAQLCPTLCDSMDCRTPGFPVHHQLPALAQIHVHGVCDAIQPPCLLRNLLLLPSIFHVYH